jgi:DNA-binding Lrp family transcriptional regulator
MNARIDDIDRKIIEMLKRNARIPYTYIAKELRMSEAAIRKRVDRLMKKGVIRRFSVEYSLENEVMAAVLVKCSPQFPVREISAKIARLPGVDHVYEVTGNYDILVVVRGDSIRSLNSYVDSIRDIEGVNETNTMIVLNVRL